MPFKSVGKAIGSAASSVADAATDVVGGVSDAVGTTVGTTVSGVADIVDQATFGATGSVFDSVSYVTGGVVDISIDDGIGVNVAGNGISMGEHGVAASADLGFSSASIGLGNEGFSLHAQAGIEASIGGFALPYHSTHVDIGSDGEVSINGQVQGTVPIPGVGLLTGQASGGFVNTSEGWGAFVDGDGTLHLPSGVSIAGGLTASYQQTDDGSHTVLGARAAVDYKGIGTVGGEVGYERLRIGEHSVKGFQAGASAQGFGATAQAQASYVGVDAGGVAHSAWTGSAGLDAPGIGTLSVDADGIRLTGALTDDPDADDVLGADAALPPGAGALEAPGAGDDAVAGGGTTEDSMFEDGAPDLGGATEPAPAPVDDVAELAAAEPEAMDDAFAQTIAAADQVESSVDDIFDGAGS